MRIFVKELNRISLIIKTLVNLMKAVTLISTAALAAILATETEAKSALAEMVEEVNAPTFALRQEYGDEYGDEAEEEP